MGIDEALRATVQEHNLSPEALAVAARVTGTGARNWLLMEKPAVPSGDALLRLMHELPGFAEKLGFAKIAKSAVA